MALRADPFGWIAVPLVPLADRAERGLDQLPALFVLQGARDGRCDERATPAGADPAVELGDERVIEVNVQTHAHSLTHTLQQEPQSAGYRRC